MPIPQGKRLNIQGEKMMPEQRCEAKNCFNTFRPSGPWGARRCDRCRKEKRPYKSDDEPF